MSNAKGFAANHSDLSMTTRVLPAFWASALINRDFTGFEADSAGLHAITRFMADFAMHYGNCDPVDVSEDVFFIKGHDALPYGVLACECMEFAFVVTRN